MPSHYLNQCRIIVNWTIRNSLNRNSNIFIQENVFESIVCETATILSWPQCVKRHIWGNALIRLRRRAYCFLREWNYCLTYINKNNLLPDPAKLLLVIVYIHTITVTSHEQCDISNFRSLDYFFNIVFGLSNERNMKALHYWPFVRRIQFSSVQLISGRRLRGLPLCPDLRRSMRLIGHMGLSYDRIGRGGLSSACPIVAWMRWRFLP